MHSFFIFIMVKVFTQYKYLYVLSPLFLRSSSSQIYSAYQTRMTPQWNHNHNGHQVEMKIHLLLWTHIGWIFFCGGSNIVLHTAIGFCIQMNFQYKIYMKLFSIEVNGKFSNYHSCKWRASSKLIECLWRPRSRVSPASEWCLSAVATATVGHSRWYTFTQA